MSARDENDSTMTNASQGSDQPSQVPPNQKPPIQEPASQGTPAQQPGPQEPAARTASSTPPPPPESGEAAGATAPIAGPPAPAPSMTSVPGYEPYEPKQPSRGEKILKAAVVVLLVLGLALSGYALYASSVGRSQSSQEPTGGSASRPTTDPADLPTPPEGLEAFYEQDVEWESCGQGAECATVLAPLDWANPNEEDAIDLSIKRYPATGTKQGTLFLNPGGPGGSGIDYADMAARAMPKEIRDAFDIAGWDPRGVGQSTPVDYLTDSEFDVFTAGPVGADENVRWAETEKSNEELAKKATERAGKLLSFVGTESTARDLDMLRQLVGDAKLNYVGASYGTFIGAQYADLFPDNVGRIVLDGAVDMNAPRNQTDFEQWMGFETLARQYVKQCEGEECPLTGSEDDKLRQIQALIDSCFENPLPTADANRPLTGNLAIYGVILPLYSAQYDMLTMALEQAMEKKDGSLLLSFADQYHDREDDGTYASNSTEAFWAINCADYLPISDEESKEQEQKMEKESLVFGGAVAGPDVCLKWPYHPKSNPKPFKAAGSDPILVVGTEYDPATPYDWAVRLEKNFDNARLLTWKGGEGHTAFLRGSSCIDQTITGYLVDGKVPDENAECTK